MNGSINEQFGEKNAVIHDEYTAKHDDVTNFLDIYIYIYTLKLGQCWAPYGQAMGQLVGSVCWLCRETLDLTDFRLDLKHQWG